MTATHSEVCCLLFVGCCLLFVFCFLLFCCFVVSSTTNTVHSSTVLHAAAQSKQRAPGSRSSGGTVSLPASGGIHDTAPHKAREPRQSRGRAQARCNVASQTEAKSKNWIKTTTLHTTTFHLSCRRRNRTCCTRHCLPCEGLYAVCCMLYDCKRRPTPHASFSLSMRGLTGSRFPHVPGFHNLRADVCMKDPKALVLSLALIRYHCMDRILELLPSMPMALQIKRLEAGGWRLDLSQSCANAPLHEVNRQHVNSHRIPRLIMSLRAQSCT